MAYAGRSRFREQQRTRGELPPPGPAQHTVDYGSSPAVARARDSIDGSPLAVAQRQTIGRLFGAPAQRQEEEDALQAKAAPVQREGGLDEELPAQGKWAVQRVEEEEPLQGRMASVTQREAMDEELPAQGKWALQRVEEEEPLQGVMADPLQRKVSMKDSGVARRTTGSGPQLTQEVNATISSGNLDDMQSTENQLRTSIANRETDLYARKDKGSDIYQSHLARIELEEDLKKKLDAEIKKLTPAPKPVKKAAPKKEVPLATSNRFAVLEVD